MNKGNAAHKAQIELTVCWFSVLAEHRGTREETLAVPEGSTGADLLDHLAAQFPALAAYRNDVRMAVNHEFAPEDKVLRGGDEVAFLTPVSGG